jgi:hypothetical protein
MNKIYQSFIGMALCSLVLVATSCEEKTEPTEYATSEQISASSLATPALLMAMPAALNNFDEDRVDGGWHACFGYPAMMHIRDMEIEDCPMGSKYSGHFNHYSNDTYLSKDYGYAGYPFTYQYQLVLAANSLINAVDTTTASEDQKGYAAAGYAYRAMIYLDMAREYEFLATDVNATGKNADGNTVTGLTVPIVTNTTTLTDVANNPRASHADMYKFIKGDLDYAVAHIKALDKNSTYGSNHTLPHLGSVYGLLARLYMWNGDYANAETAAANAIANSNTTPITQAEGLSTTKGFNTLTDFMWGGQTQAEDRVVTSGIINWTSWVSNEATYGYAGAGSYFMISKSLYDKIKDTDWRKLMFKAPSDGTLTGKEPWIDAANAEGLPDYATLKFRPGSGDINDYKVGSASAYPLMRVEEMYLIQAEAAAHQDAARGKALLESFMTTYRDENYTCKASSQEDVITEIILQKRIELWGEGQLFFDYKRLGLGVTRGYTGTNFPDAARFNVTGRPAWMNWVLPRSEEERNAAVKGNNNSDPSDLYTPWTGK